LRPLLRRDHRHELHLGHGRDPTEVDLPEHAPAPRRADRERRGAGRDPALVDPRLLRPAPDARDRRRTGWESDGRTRLAADGELAHHALAPMVLAEELEEPRLAKRHLHGAALALRDVLGDALI